MRFKVAEVTNIERDSDGFVTNDPTIGPALQTFDAAYPAKAREFAASLKPAEGSWIEAGLTVCCAWESAGKVICVTLD